MDLLSALRLGEQMTTEPNLLFVNLDTDTVEDIADDAFVIDTESAALSPDEIDTLDAADQYGSFGDDAAAIVRRVGVSVADLWAAYKREQQRADDGWRWRADRGGWNHCDRRAEYDDDGVTCRVCYRFMSHDDANVRMIE